VGLDSSVEVKANLASADLVNRLGGEIGSAVRSNSFEASLDIRDERILFVSSVFRLVIVD
jgi:hypothetical protein